MSNPWLIAIISGVVSPIILGVITGIVKFTKEEGLIIKFFNGVTKGELNDAVKRQIIASLPSQDFVTQDELNDVVKQEIMAHLTPQDSIAIKSGIIEFFDIKGSSCKVPEKIKLMDKDAPKDREIIVFYNEDRSSYFKRKPEIILGISFLNSEHTSIEANLALKATAQDVNETCFRVKVETFFNSYFYRVEVNWLAYGIKK